MNLPRIIERTMMISAIYWQPNEQLLTVRTADGGHTQIGGQLSSDELSERLGAELAERIQHPDHADPTLSDLVVHALRGDALGYLKTRENGEHFVVPAIKDDWGNTVPAEPEDDSRTGMRP